MLKVLLRRKARSFANAILRLTPWERGRDAAFLLAGFWMLYGLYAGFCGLLRHLDSVQLIGPLLVWKLTALALATTFSMVVLSSLIISLTTLFYSYDLPFLMKAPLRVRTIFMDKSLEAAFFSSWMIALILVPYVLALGRSRGLGWPFYLAFAFALPPYLLLAAALGMGFTLALMRLFPSPRTRDFIWILSSLSIAVLYVLFRFSRPERLIRPDALQVVAEYISYLQAPTAPYLPSWWLTRALWGHAHGDRRAFWTYSALLYGLGLLAYAVLVAVASKTYAAAYSGAQEGRRSGRKDPIEEAWEMRLLKRLKRTNAATGVAALIWKERKTFFRDVSHWSQLVLVLALLCVYLFSIQRLPLDTPDLKSLVSFLNLAVAGFVLSSLGLRFTFPAISLEGRSFWVLKAAPLSTGQLMAQKLLSFAIPMTVLSSVLVLASNRFLQADPFIAWTTFATMLVMTWTLAAMGVGFGAIFPRFDVVNIHQVESSAGGFAYMAACLFYVGATVALEAWPVQMHFQARWGRAGAWHWPAVWACAAGLLLLNAAAVAVPWLLGRRALEGHEPA